MVILEVKSLQKVYTSRFGGASVKALSNVSFAVEDGEFVAVMGESGSGKTTLLNILAALDRPTSGRVVLDDKDVSAVRDSQMATFRRENLGFVFQEFNLLDTFSNRDNILLPLVLSGIGVRQMEQRIGPLAKQLRIDGILDKFPYEISGGQKQRVAIARALITQPKLLLADEPTGALDSRSADDVMKIFQGVNRTGQTVIMVTHSVKAASCAERVLFIKDGEVYHQLYRGEQTDEQMYQRISDTLTLLTTGGDAE